MTSPAFDQSLAMLSRSTAAKLFGAALVAVVLVLPASFALALGATEASILPLLAALVPAVLLGSMLPWAALQRRRWRAYGELVNRHRPLLTEFFRRRGLLPDAIEPLTEMVFQRLCQEGVRVPVRLDASRVLPVASLVYRDEQLLATASADAPWHEPRPAAITVPDTLTAEMGERLRQLDAALGRLPALMRTCLRLRYERNFSEGQVATLTRLRRERVAEILQQASSRLGAGGVQFDPR